MSGLDDLQRAVLLALANGQDAAAAGADAAPDVAMREWVASWEPELVELAGLLVRTWAARDDAPMG
ncbi:MAG: hypothetical protein Q8R60_03780 [Mycobacteriales bacterium]|nr:hypothetical protein [Mycobacteriales bacterium]